MAQMIASMPVASPLSRPSHAASFVQHGRSSSGRSRRGVQPVAALPEFSDAMNQLAAHLPLAYEPIASPCSLQKCGDIIYRSTLAKEDRYLDWKGYALLATAAAYLFIPPGVLPGLFDLYVLAPLQRKQSKVYSKDDIILGKRLGAGGFGEVYKAELVEGDGKPNVPVVVKKAREFGEAEVWMNERMTRIGGRHCADFITAFAENKSSSTPASQGGLGVAASSVPAIVWLVWRFEGKETLWDLMLKRDWPYNLEEPLFGRELRLTKGPTRRAAVMKAALTQLVEAIQAMHLSGLVHRDIKPQNCIISTIDSKIKLIDLGAAADLRIGINYVPNEYLLDPRYAPPQQYIMSTQTPKPPPKPIATLLSPVLWLMEGPDKFDMYAVGIVFLQMVIPSLRNDDKLIAFNRKLEGLGHDLRRWRREEEKKGVTRDDKEGFDVLDMQDGAGWDFLCRLLAFNPKDRLTASAALKHPWLGGKESGVNTAVNNTLSPIMSGVKSVSAALSSQGDLLTAAASRDGSLTEAQLMEELGEVQRATDYDRSASQTVAWFDNRQKDISRKLEARQSRDGTGSSSRSNGVNGSKQVKVSAAAAAGGSSKLKVPAMFGAGPVVKGKLGQVAAGKPSAKAAAGGKGAKAAAPAEDKKFNPFGFLKKDRQ